MKRLFSVLVILFVTNLSFAQDEVLATIGNKKITIEEFNKKYAQASKTFNPPTKEQFLEDLIRYEVGLQEAEKKNLEKDPTVQDRIKQEVYKAYVEKEIAQTVQNIKVSDKEMENFYKQNPEIRFSHILIEYKQDATPQQIAEAKKRATEIFEEVKKSKRPFEELVRIYTDDPLSKQTGGDVGFQSRVTLLPAFYEELLKMKVGEVKGILSSPFGFHIVKVTSRRAYENANKMQLRAAVFDEKRKVIFDQLFDKLKKQYSIKTNPKLLK